MLEMIIQTVMLTFMLKSLLGKGSLLN